jgi:succinate dehydrogenase/fumarate reductase flavoprotein subunit
VDLKERDCDVLVIGGGLAALRAAVAARSAGATVVVLSKGSPGTGVVGLNAVVPGTDDTPARYLADMLRAGEFLGDPHLAAPLTHEAWWEVDFLEGLGLSFRHGDSYAPRLTSGHSLPRTVYTTDRTGPEIIAVLLRWLRKHDVTLLPSHEAVALLADEGRVCGAVAVDCRSWRLEAQHAGAVILATGGLGPLYAFSTNPPDLSGDGYALAYAAGAQLLDMEFVQFEPFVMLPPASPAFTVSFLLADGPEIYDKSKESFLPSGGQGLTKEELARRVYRQVQAGRGSPAGGVYFDLRRVPRAKLANHPRFLAACKAAGRDPSAEALEVGAAQHYMLGGIRIDENAATTVPGLYAAGEVAGGVHGAGRLAGNSGTEVLVFGARAGAAAARYSAGCSQVRLPVSAIAEQARIALPLCDRQPAAPGQISQTLARLGQVLWQEAGLERSGTGLARAATEVGGLSRELGALGAPDLAGQLKLLAARHRLLLAEMIIQAASLRTESRGVHYRVDFRERDDQSWLKSIVLAGSEGKIISAHLGRALPEAPFEVR